METGIKKNLNTSSVIVTDDREAYNKAWYVVVVQMNCEKKVAARLKSLGFKETYVPTQQEIHKWSDRRRRIDKIVIPMMVFIKLAPNELKTVYCQPYIYKFLSAPGDKTPAVIPDKQIDTLKYMLGNADSEITIENITINKNDKVRVIRGSLKGIEGYACHNSEGKVKIAIIIENLGCACVTLPLTDLELIK